MGGCLRHWPSVLLGLTALGLAQCRSPTEVTFVLTTDVPCDAINGVIVTAGAPGSVEGESGRATSHACTEGGELGSIVTVPSSDKTGRFALRVVLGVGRDPGACQPPAYGTGCIVARRTLRYVAHTPLTLSIPLRAVCDGVACDADQTCVNGACTGAEIADPSACSGSGCGEGSLAPPAAPPVSPSPLVCGDMNGLQRGAAWPMLGFCPTHIGRGPVAGAQTSNLRWAAKVGGAIESGIAVAADGTVYFGANDNKLYAVAADGNVRWSVDQTVPLAVVPAIARDGTLAVGTRTHLSALSPGGGAVTWSFDVAGQFATSAGIAADGTIYVGAGTSNDVYALTKGGAGLWKFPTKGEVISSPAIGFDGTVYAGSEDRNLYAMHKDGTQKWLFVVNEGTQTPVVGAQGWIYFNGKASVCAVDANGDLQWAVPTDGEATIPAIGPDGTVYAGSTSGKFYALDPLAKGKLKWGEPLHLTSFDAATQPAIGADGIVYIGATDGKFYAITKEGTVKWQLASGGAIHGPAAIGADGTVFFGSDDQKLYAVGP